MKMTFELDMSDEDDYIKANQMRKVSDLCAMIYNFKEWLRKERKNADDMDEVLEKVWEAFYRELEEYQIDIDMLYQ